MIRTWEPLPTADDVVESLYVPKQGEFAYWNNALYLGDGMTPLGTLVPFVTTAAVRTTKTIQSSATPTINADTTSTFGVTALAVPITAVTVTGTLTDGQRLHIYVVATGTMTIALGAQFEASTVALPTTTNGTNRLDIECIYDAATSKFRVLQVS